MARIVAGMAIVLSSGAIAALSDTSYPPPMKRASVSTTDTGRAKPRRAPLPAPAPSDHFAAVHAGATGQPWKI